MRIPQPIATQVEALCSRYQEWIAAGGNPTDPPCFLEKTDSPPELAKQQRAETAGNPTDPPSFLEKPPSQRAIAAINEGLSLRQAAQKAGVSVNTVRKVKAILDLKSENDRAVPDGPKNTSS